MDQPSAVPELSEETKLSRRRLLKIAAATGGAVAASTLIPNKWVKPVVDVGLLPAHAQISQVRFTVTARWTEAFAEVCCEGHSGPVLEIQVDYCLPNEGFTGWFEYDFSGGTEGEGCVGELGPTSLFAAAEDGEVCDTEFETVCVYFGDQDTLKITVIICEYVGGELGDCVSKSITVNNPL